MTDNKKYDEILKILETEFPEMITYGTSYSTYLDLELYNESLDFPKSSFKERFYDFEDKRLFIGNCSLSERIYEDSAEFILRTEIKKDSNGIHYSETRNYTEILKRIPSEKLIFIKEINDYWMNFY